MKNLKKIIALIVVLTLVITVFSACGDKAENSDEGVVKDFGKVVVEEVGTAAVEAFEKIDSVHISQNVDLSANLGGMDSLIKVNMESDIDVAGDKMHAKGRADSNGLTMDMEMYVEENGDEASVYVNVNNSSWMKQALSVAQLKADPSYNDYYESAVFLMNALQGVNKSETTHMGKSAIMVTGVLDNEDPEGIMGSMGVSSPISSSGITTEHFQQMLTGLEAVQVTAYFEKSTGLPLQIDLDMTAFMNSVYVNLGKVMGQTISADVEYAKASMVFTEYNNTSADVPEEVRSAVSGK